MTDFETRWRRKERLRTTLVYLLFVAVVVLTVHEIALLIKALNITCSV